MQQRPQIPGPKGVPFLGVVPHFKKDPTGFLLESAKKYGSICYFDLKVFDSYLVTDPDAISHVVLSNKRNYVKSQFYDKVVPVVGRGLLTSDKQSWRNQRRLVQPAFSQSKVDKMSEDMVTEAQRLCAKLEKKNGEVVDLAHEFMLATRDIIMRAVFGQATGEIFDGLSRDWDYLNDVIGKRFWNAFPVLEKIPTPQNLRFNRALSNLDRLVKDIIAVGETEMSSSNTLLSMLLQSQETAESGEGKVKLSPTEVRDNVVTFLLAGHETTSIALSWTLYYLSTSPKIQDDVYKECRAYMNDSERGFARYTKLPLTRAAIEEAMRLRPPAWVFSRQNIEDDEICGHRIRKGSAVMMSPFVMHRLEEHWPDPEKYDPSRFLGNAQASRPKYSYIPFGVGERSCLGNHFAMMEAVTIVAELLSRFRFTLTHPDVRMQPNITLKPEPGVFCKVEKRLR